MQPNHRCLREMNLNHLCLRSFFCRKSFIEFRDQKGTGVQSPRTERLKCRGWSGKRICEPSVDPAISKTSGLRISAQLLDGLQFTKPYDFTPSPCLFQAFPSRNHPFPQSRQAFDRRLLSLSVLWILSPVSSCSSKRWLSNLEIHPKVREHGWTWYKCFNRCGMIKYTIGLWFQCFWMFRDYVCMVMQLYLFECILLTHHVRFHSSWLFCWTCCCTATHQRQHYCWKLFLSAQASLFWHSLTKSAWQGARGSRHIQIMERTEGIISFRSLSLQWSKFVFHFHPRELSQVWPIPIKSMLMWRHTRNVQVKTFELAGAVLCKRFNFI